MGQRVNPSLIRRHQPFRERLESASYTRSLLNARYVAEDHIIRTLATEILPKHSVIRVIIEHVGTKAILIHIQSHKSNLLAGENGANLEKLRTALAKKLGSKYASISVGLLSLQNPEADAEVICTNIVEAIEFSSGKNFMKTIKEILSTVNTNTSLLGIAIRCSGRMYGASIASRQKSSEGTTKLQSVNADIQKAVGHAMTPTGMMGVIVIVSRVPKDRTRDAFDMGASERAPRPQGSTPYRSRQNWRAPGGFRANASRPENGNRGPRDTSRTNDGRNRQFSTNIKPKEPTNV